MTLIYREVLETGKIIEREYTPEEVAESEKSYQAGLEKQALMEKREADKAAAQAKLSALGLTAEDLKALGL